MIVHDCDLDSRTRYEYGCGHSESCVSLGANMRGKTSTREKGVR